MTAPASVRPAPGANRPCADCGVSVHLELTGAWRAPFYVPCVVAGDVPAPGDPVSGRGWRLYGREWCRWSAGECRAGWRDARRTARPRFWHGRRYGMWSYAAGYAFGTVHG